MTSTDPTAKRAIWVDWMRVAACFMVMLVHSTEPFYLGGEGAQILTRSDAFWAAFFDSFVRACVPLFIVASSFLQFPLHYTTGEFFRRRAVRILIPFAIWTVVYALVWGEPVENFRGLLLNFNYAAGHLWFVYMLVGLYLIIPLAVGGEGQQERVAGLSGDLVFDHVAATGARLGGWRRAGRDIRALRAAAPSPLSALGRG